MTTLEIILMMILGSSIGLNLGLWGKIKENENSNSK